MSRSASALQVSDGGPGSGKSNLWSAKAREDIYNRRQNGEEWETICKDYPNRTRHAMQQQYSVMRKQNAPDAPANTPSRRGGRRRRASTRGKWTSVNKLQSSSEDSDPELDDDEEEEEYEEDSHVADENSLVADEDITLESPRPGPLLARSATEPSSRPSTAKQPLFPNLLAPPNPPIIVQEPKTGQPESSKRSGDVEGTDSESRSSSHLSKRRKYSTEPSETFGVLSDSSMSQKSALDAFKVPFMVFHPDVIAKSQETWRTISTAYETEKSSRKESFEAALRRASLRANNAEQKVQAVSQTYADSLKMEKENCAKAIEIMRKELEAGREKIKRAESVDSLRISVAEMTIQLSAKEQQLKLYDQLRTQINTQVEQLKALQFTALDKSEEVKNQHAILTASINNFNEQDLGDIGTKTIQRQRREIQVENETMVEMLGGQRSTWRQTSEAVAAFHAQFEADIAGSSKDPKKDE